ncbi:hypothetical protein MNBD_GAMMA07-169 [hydrothermal vent metagenome]|uniref:Death on curing protein, Doc toxin n=1 Tax=hydrothermal vent metagenome TaxID=652676 RepID=A0A3B0WPU7_9ZZZZ
MPELIISPQAEQDLLDIWLYIAEDNTVNADRYLDKLNDKAISLSESSGIGKDRPELAPNNLKSFPVDHYMLYYLPIKTGIELVRILRTSRDTQPLFKGYQGVSQLDR